MHVINIEYAIWSTMAHGSVYAFYAVNDTKNTKYVKATCHCMQQMPLYATYAIVLNIET